MILTTLGGIQITNGSIAEDRQISYVPDRELIGAILSAGGPRTLGALQ
ncbi:MAG TPA: hypothetical protein VNZ53_24545 [Steroidobacteraceae bacterium]|nr:hypothetical protein [Steroidobacteraceae bacterium]